MLLLLSHIAFIAVTFTAGYLLGVYQTKNSQENTEIIEARDVTNEE